MCIIFNVFVEFVTILLLFKFWIFSPKVYGILVHQPGIKPCLINPALLALKGKVLTTGLPVKSFT